MNINTTKELIKDNKINKTNALDAILSFENHYSQEDFAYFNRLIVLSSYYWEFGFVTRILNILDCFEKNLEQTDSNKFALLYSKATVYLYIKDGISAIQTCYEIKKLKNIDDDKMFYVDNVIVNALYDNKEYKFALEKNLTIYDTVAFTKLNNINKVIVMANNVLFYTSLDEYEKASWQYHAALNFAKDHEDCKEMLEIFDLLKIFAIFKFESKYSENEINYATNLLLSKFDVDINNNLYENISIYEEIFDKLICNGKKDVVYKCCKKMLNLLFNVYDISSIYRYLLMSISKKQNFDEYVSCLEHYTRLLEEKNKLDNNNVGAFYEQTSNYYTQHEKYIHDPLTKCLSRGIYEDKKMSKESKIVIYLDLNNLKIVNDVNGHNFGDEYIKKFANNLLTTFSNEYCFRIGGDEFLVVSPNLTLDETIKKLNSLNELPLFEAKVNDKFSAGIAINTNNNTVEELTKIADKYLYKAKNSKKDFYVIAKQ